MTLHRMTYVPSSLTMPNICTAPPLHSRHELIDELVVGVAAHALVLAADIERAPQQLLIVGACAGTFRYLFLMMEVDGVPRCTGSHDKAAASMPCRMQQHITCLRKWTAGFGKAGMETLRTRVDADGQAHVRRDAAARRVQRQLRLGHAHRLRRSQQLRYWVLFRVGSTGGSAPI